jgi:hypothetical protein
MYGGATSAATTEPATAATGGIVAGAPDPLGVARDQDAGTEGTPRIANLKERMRRKCFAVLQSLKLECNGGDDAPPWMQDYEDLRILSLRIISQESQLPLAPYSNIMFPINPCGKSKDMSLNANVLTQMI